MALARFAAKVRFDAATGCVIWRGGTTTARNGEGRLGAFWFGQRRWVASRWAAKYVHGLDIDNGQEVNVLCDNELCVQHLRAEFPIRNTRQHYLLLGMGYGEEEPQAVAQERKEDGVPFYPPPDWLRPFLHHENQSSDDCPF